MYVETNQRTKVEDPAEYIRRHPNLSIEELVRATGETEFYIRCVKEVDNDPRLQRGAGKVNREWMQRDKEVHSVTI